MVLLPKSPIRHFQTISPFTGTDKFGHVTILARERDQVGLKVSFPWAVLILFDRDQRRDREYTTHGKTHDPFILSGR